VSFIPTELPTKFIALVQSVGKITGKLLTLFIMPITKGITNGKFHLYFPKSSGTVHFPIALLIIVLYRQNHQRIEKSSVIFGGFLTNFD
jgi:hypothetical protein